MLTQAILIGLIAAFGKFDFQLGTLYAFRPIVLCPLVGLVLGDLQSGLAIGASLELLFMGSISIGAYVPPDETIGGVLACAFAIQLGQSTEQPSRLPCPSPRCALPSRTSSTPPCRSWLTALMSSPARATLRVSMRCTS